MRRLIILSILLMYVPAMLSQNYKSTDIWQKEIQQKKIINNLFGNIKKVAEITRYNKIQIKANSQDSLILIKLFQTTNGGGWTNTWDTTHPVSTWYGVYLEGSGRVSRLLLAANNLSGTIPPELGNLDSLFWLDLAQNNLTGTIPIELGNLKKMKILNLRINNLTGNIPAELGNLSELENLNLSNNQLSGSIPIELCNLSKLNYLILSNNLLDGEIPNELKNLSELILLSLSHNQLSGNIPMELGNLNKLMTMDFSYNQLSGEIPDEIIQIDSLQYLLLANNQLSGAIPDLSGCTKLKTLALQGNQLSGKFPTEITNLTGLTNILLGNNQLEGNIPSNIGTLTELKVLNIGDNNLKGTIPSSLWTLNNLEILRLNENYFYGQIPPEIGNLTLLTWLDLKGNLFSGEIPGEIGNLTQLQNLELNNNYFTGAIPTSLANLSNINYLYLNNNQFTDLPDISNLSPTYCLVNYNNLTFEDIEPNINIPNIQYTPQNKVGKVKYLSPQEGDKVVIKIVVGGENNTYQWYKNDIAINGETNDSLVISDYTASTDSGIYYCKINNSIVTQLTLQSNNFYIGVSLPQYTIDVNITPLGTGTVNGTGTYNEGDTAILAAAPANGYKFDGWTKAGILISMDNPYKFPVYQNKTLTANFSTLSTINSMNDNKIWIYPNPAINRIIIKSNINNQIKKIRIINLWGKTLITKKVLSSDNISIDIIQLQPGIYILQIFTINNNIKTIKLIKK